MCWTLSRVPGRQSHLQAVKDHLKRPEKAAPHTLDLSLQTVRPIDSHSRSSVARCSADSSNCDHSVTSTVQSSEAIARHFSHYSFLSSPANLFLSSLLFLSLFSIQYERDR